MVSVLEAKQLDKEYMAWRAREIQAGRIPKPPVPPYDPAKKVVPFLSESGRKTLGAGLPELETEIAQIKATRATGKAVDYSRAMAVGDEVARLKQQEADIAWSIGEQTGYEKFVRGPRGVATQPATRAHPLKKAVGWWKGLRTRNKLLFGGAGVVAATLAFGGKENHNTIEGLHPFSDGMGTQILREHSDFGSGFVGLKGILFHEGYATFQATKEQLYKGGIGAYSLYEWERTRGARETFSRFAAHKENQLKFPAMGDRGSFAAHMRGEITEFKDEFASRWDPLRKLATKLYGESNEALGKLTARPEFRAAVGTALKGEGKLLGKGAMGEARAYAGEMVLKGQKHKFEFVAKTTLGRGAKTQSAIVAEQEFLHKFAAAEGAAMEKLGHLRAPSLYGRGGDFGVEKNTLIMEKFNLTKPLVEEGKITLPSGFQITKAAKENPLSADEVVQLKSFMKEAHKKGITHTDLHADNVVRALNPETGVAEPAILDWGMANRFQEVAGVGGTQAHIMETGAAAVLRSKVLKNVGRDISGKEFSEVTDLMRIEAHRFGSKANRSSRQAVNSVYDFQRKQMNLSEAVDELNHLKQLDSVKPVHMKAAETLVSQRQTAMDASSELLGEVADSVSNYIMKADHAPSVAKTATELLPKGTNVLRKVVNKGVKKQELAYADTVIADTMRMSAVETNNLAATMANKARKAAVARNRRFEEITRQSVGVGLRQSAKATKGHTTFSSTGSTVVQ